jgi:ADP-ribose pyrophosphatase YjhB (NUDIX family)
MSDIQVEVIAIIMKPEGKVLIGRNSEGKLVIPGDTVRLYEQGKDTLARAFIEKTGLIIQPQSVMFVSEIVKPPAPHRIIICMYAVVVSGELSAGGDLTEVKWVDVRALGTIQDDMDDVAIDAFHKFSIVLKSQAMGRAN